MIIYCISRIRTHTLSHLAAGYRLGAKKEEDRMIHTDLVPYEKLSEVAKHYDWIVVRTSLRISSAKV